MLDALHQHLAWQVALGWVLAGAPGAIPGWNPYTFGGVPFLADPQMQVSYPPTLLYRFLPLAIANGCFLVMHLVLGTVGTGLFLRATGLSAVASFGGAVSFGLGTHAALLVMAAPVLCAWGWFPWACLFAWRLGRSPSARAVFALAAVMGWLALAGCPQYFLYAVVATSIVASSASPLCGRRVRLLGGAFVLVLAAAGTTLVPFACYLPHTTRAAPLSPSAVREDAVVAEDLLSYVAPDAAVPLRTPAKLIAADRWVRFHYGGLLLVPLALSGLASRGDRRPRCGAAILVAAGVLLAMQPALPGGGWLRELPPFGHMRRAGLWLVLSDFGLAWLAAMGLQRLIDGEGRAVKALVLGLVAGVVLAGWLTAWAGPVVGTFGIAGAVLAGNVLRMLSGRTAAAAMALVTFMDVTRYGAHARWAAPSGLVTAVSAEERFLLAASRQVGEIRCVGWPPGVTPGTRAKRTVTGGTLEEAVRKIRPGLDPNLPALSGIRSADGDNPLVPSVRWAALDRLGRHWAVDPEDTRRLLVGLGVTHVIADPLIAQVLPPPDGRRVFSGTACILELPGDGGPRLVPQRAGLVLSALRTPAGDWEVLCDLAEPATLVLPETGLPGWSAGSVRGAAVTLPDGYGNLCVLLKPGRQRLTMHYRPPGCAAGLLLSFVALGFLLGVTGREGPAGVPPRRARRRTGSRAG